ncbi:glycosyltransferase family 4 protein [Bacillus alveayuensis]|uniref:glycosyltransferase family 4 protein n=1 Tax=Aeribacillus alveayuensis TaxID=279215 RepID=UPI0005CD1EB0|nr:glycosyltransferase family 4 protein [Bacillus alveayuensis]
MKIVHLNTFDTEGGAARAANRLHNGLLDLNINSHMIVQNKKSYQLNIHGPTNKFQKLSSLIRPQIDALPKKIYNTKTPFSVAWLPNRKINKNIVDLKPDIVHLHWITNGFYSLTSLKKLKLPIVWTLHDSWPFTGGCHVPGECEKYIKSCGACPQLNSTNKKDLSYHILKMKKKLLKDINLTLVAPSNWLAECARKSEIFKDFRIEVIHNGLFCNIFKPIDKNFAREILNLPKDKNLILFGAVSSLSDRNKGFDYLKSSLKEISLNNNDIELIVFGDTKPNNPIKINLKVHYFGFIHDDYTLALLYSAADLMCVPSKQEAFGQTAAEAMACGTPVVAFNTSGLKDIVDHKINGYLANPYDYKDFARGIKWILTKQEELQIGKNARKKVQSNFNIVDITKKYINLYRELL